MEDQATWKGHTFTLLVFTGIVMLCSIFFILGMLVGRTQGQKMASVPAAGASAKNDTKAVKDDKPDFTFYDSVKKADSGALVPAPAKPAPDPESLATEPRVEPKKAPERVQTKPEPPPVATPPPPELAPANSLNYQIGIFTKSANAHKLLDEVKKKGFRAFILEPSDGDSNPIFRVQVGPFTNPVEAEEAKKKLETAGYAVVPKK